MAIHYPRRTSKIKRARKFGFRARMKSKKGRQMLNRRRRIGRTLNVRNF
jgi:large subunit ribosomal protein L34